MDQRLRARPWLMGLLMTTALAGCGVPHPLTSEQQLGDTRLVADGSTATLLRIADSTRAGGDLPSAVGLYRRAHEVAPEDPVPLTRLGGTLAELGSYTEAAEAYRHAWRLKPDDPEINRGFGNVLLALDKPQLAIGHFEEALKKRPEDPRLHNGLGIAHDKVGRHDLAQQSYQSGLRFSPDHVSLRNNLGLSQALAGDFAAAIATLEPVALSPRAAPRHRQNLALVYGLAGQTDKAAETARRDLDEAAVRNNLGYYALLRAMEPKSRSAAITSRERIQESLAAAEPPRRAADTATDEDVAQAAPRPEVTREALAQQPAVERPPVAVFERPSEPAEPVSSTGVPRQLAAVAPPEVTAASPPRLAAAGRHRIQIAAAGSEEAGLKEWTRFKREHHDLVGGLDVVTQRAEIAERTVWRVQIGPLGHAEATRICGELTRRGAACLVVRS